MNKKVEKKTEKEYSFKGMKISFVKSTEPLAKAKSGWKWLDSEIKEFRESGDDFRDIVVPESMSLKDRKELRAGIRGRLNSKDFRDSGIILHSVTEDDKLKMQLQKGKD